MGIAYDTYATGYSGASPLSFSHTCSASTDRILFLLLNVRGDPGYARPTLSSVTYGGSAMTLKTSGTYDSGDFGNWYLYYMVGPAAGVNTASVSWSAPYGSTIRGVSASYTGVNQLTPMGTLVSTTQVASLAACTATVTSQIDGLVIDFRAGRSSGGATTYTLGGGQTSRLNENLAAGGGSTGNGHSEKAGAASVAMTWDPDVSCHTVVTAVPLLPTDTPRGMIVAYIDDLASDDRRLLDANGNRIHPWEIRADAWVRYAGWAPVTSVVYDSLVDDPTCGYIEDVSWSSDDDVATTTTSRMDLGEIIIARASAQSAG